MGHAPYAAKARLRKRNTARAQPIQTLKGKVEGDDRQEHPARAANPGTDDARLVAKDKLGGIDKIVAAAEHHADGKEQRRQNHRWAPSVAAAKEHVAKGQRE